jgi:hypothetical protein
MTIVAGNFDRCGTAGDRHLKLCSSQPVAQLPLPAVSADANVPRTTPVKNVAHQYRPVCQEPGQPGGRTDESHPFVAEGSPEERGHTRTRHSSPGSVEPGHPRVMNPRPLTSNT